MNVNTGQTAAPAPHCADCGYPNGSSQGTVAVPAEVQGPVLASRQGVAAVPPPGAIPYLPGQK